MSTGMTSPRKIPGQTKKSHVSNCGWLDIPSDGPYSTLGERELETLLGAPLPALKYPCTLDLSLRDFYFHSLAFLNKVPNVLKELNASHNSLGPVMDLPIHLTYVKRLCLADNNASSLRHLELYTSLLVLNLSQNRFTEIPKLPKTNVIQALILSNNQIRTGLENLQMYPSLSYLDLSSNGLDMTPAGLYWIILQPLLKVPSLKSLNLADNPSASSILSFQHFIVHCLPKLKTLDGVEITSEMRKEAQRLSTEGTWNHLSKTLETLNDEDKGIYDEGRNAECLGPVSPAADMPREEDLTPGPPTSYDDENLQAELKPMMDGEEEHSRNIALRFLTRVLPLNMFKKRKEQSSDYESRDQGPSLVEAWNEVKIEAENKQAKQPDYDFASNSTLSPEAATLVALALCLDPRPAQPTKYMRMI